MVRVRALAAIAGANPPDQQPQVPRLEQLLLLQSQPWWVLPLQLAWQTALQTVEGMGVGVEAVGKGEGEDHGEGMCMNVGYRAQPLLFSMMKITKLKTILLSKAPLAMPTMTKTHTA